jgi:hypothetical protein
MGRCDADAGDDASIEQYLGCVEYDPGMNSMARLRAKWLGWFKTLTNDVYALHYHRLIWRRMAGALDANPGIPRTRLVDYFAKTYAESQSVAVRRLTDHDRRVVSFARLLRDLGQHPDAITKQWWMGLNSNEREREAWLEGAWRQYDSSGIGYLDPLIPHTDLIELAAKVAAVKFYVDKYLAHQDVNRPEVATLTFGEIDSAIDHLGGLLGKYAGILEASDRSILEPIVAPDLMQPLRVDWFP